MKVSPFPADSSTTKSSKTYIDAFKRFALHVGLLLKKNLTLQTRSLKTTLFQYWSPLIACYVLLILQNIGNDITSGVEINPPIGEIGKIPRCFRSESNPDDCISLAYGVVGPSEPWIHSVMNYVAKANDFDQETDMKYLGEILPHEFNKYLNAHINTTQAGIIFCTEQWKIDSIIPVNIPCRLEAQTDKKLVLYSIIYNITSFLISPVGEDYRLAHPKHPVASSLKLWIDNGIFAYFSKDKDALGNEYIDLDPEDPDLPRLEVKTQDYPKTHFRFWIGMDMVTSLGGIMFFLPYMINFVVTLMDIMKEKHNKLRQGLTVMGMSDSAYWTSWYVTSIASNFTLTMSTIFSGYLFGFKFFTDTPVIVVFSLFFMFGMSLQAFSFFLTTLCSNMVIAYVSTYGILLLFIMFELILGNILFSSLVFYKDLPNWFLPIRFIFRFVPAFNYSAIFGHITAKSGNHYDINSNYWVEGSGFKYGDLYNPLIEEGKFGFKMPAPMYFFGELLMNIVFYSVLTWYCDNVISHNRGCEKSPFFFLPSLRSKFFTKLPILAQKSHKKNDDITTSGNTDNEKESFDNPNAPNQEYLQTDPGDSASIESKGLRIIGLNKIYSRAVLGYFRKKEIHAVKDLCLDISQGELLSILGHNGAGKTTLIGVLTGILKPTSGTARICDLDIRNEMDEIRKIMGVCPQFDILWSELTADEHLQIYARIKGIPEARIEEEIVTRLREVNLLSVRNAQAGTFSGGMKRRLSMAIAFIGDPQIVFLDEPTTGMDPKNRRYIWELILNMKKNRIVVLTTHAMEEADALSDRIAVMAGGQLKCVGTSLFLKNAYGDGYKLSLVVEKEDVNEVLDCLNLVIPSGKLLDFSGGSVMVGLPLTETEELQAFFGIMEGKDESDLAKKFKSRIKDWGLSHTTLEEVFMKVTRGQTPV